MLEEQQQQEERTEQVVEGAEKTGMSPLSWAAIGSIALSWYYFFAQDDKQMGLFVGLWPPTFLALGSYFKINEIEQEVQRISRPGSTIRNAVQDVMRNR